MTTYVDVTIIVDDKDASVSFLELESGDHFQITIENEDDETAQKIGWEILSWIELMRDALEEESK